jgi:hypothetical protein
MGHGIGCQVNLTKKRTKQVMLRLLVVEYAVISPEDGESTITARDVDIKVLYAML